MCCTSRCYQTTSDETSSWSQSKSIVDVSIWRSKWFLIENGLNMCQKCQKPKKNWLGFPHCSLEVSVQKFHYSFLKIFSRLLSWFSWLNNDHGVKLLLVKVLKNYLEILVQHQSLRVKITCDFYPLIFMHPNLLHKQ